MQPVAQITNCTMLVLLVSGCLVAWEKLPTEDYDTAQAFLRPDCAALNAPLGDVYACKR